MAITYIFKFVKSSKVLMFINQNSSYGFNWLFKKICFCSYNMNVEHT